MSVLTERSDDKSYLSDTDSDDDVSRVEKARSKSPVLNYSSDNYSDDLSDKDSLAPSSVMRTTRKSTRTSARTSARNSARDSLQNSAGNSRYSSQLSRNSTRNNSERASQMNSAVSKLKSSRSGYSHRGYPNQKVDPITARILSANQKRRAIAGNQAGEIKKKNMQLYEEIKSLRILCRNQEKSLKQYESTQSALPRVLQNFEHDKALLKERLRKVKENEKRLEREKKRLDIENEKNQKKLKELNNIIQTKNLDERWNLQQRLEMAERVAAENVEKANHVNRKFELEQAALERQLKKEIRRRTKAEQENDRNKEELRNIQEKLTEKEKQLNYSNIYIQRQNKKSKQKRSSSLALPAPPKEEPAVDLNATDEISTSGAPFMTSASPAPIKEEPIVEPEKISTPRDPTPEPEPIKIEPVAPPTPPKPEKSADALLDEMLFGSKVEEKKAIPPQSPTLFDMDDKPKLSSQDSVPEFDFGPTKKTSKDSILAQLRDLHGNNDSPSNEKPKMNFNIFDSAPKIDPKEAPKSKEDELDELLNLGSKKQSNMASTMSIKRSDPKVYDFSEPINNLHEGKASSGKDFRSPTKKENLIDNLFGGTDTFDDLEEVY